MVSNELNRIMRHQQTSLVRLMMKQGELSESGPPVVYMNHLIGTMLAITDQETRVGTPYY